MHNNSLNTTCFTFYSTNTIALSQFGILFLLFFSVSNKTQDYLALNAPPVQVYLYVVTAKEIGLKLP